MPRFLDQGRSLLVTTNMKVLYSSLCRQAELHSIGEARMVREILLGGRHRHLMFVRNPYDRLVSAWVDKFQTQPCWLGTPRFDGWQKIQHRYLKELGVDPGSGDELIKEVLTGVDFGTFIERLPRLFMRDAHLRPQHHRMSVSIRMRVRVVPLRIDELIRVEEIDHPGLRDDLGIELGTIRENATTHGPSSDYFTPRLREIVDRIYAKDFDLLGYPRSTASGG